jgi:DNA processing protein
LKVDRERLKYWLALTRAKGIAKRIDGRALRELTKKSNDVRDIFEGAIPAKSFKLKRSDWDWVEEELDLIDRHGVRIITLKDRDYPAPLLNTHDPPLLLYIKGTPPEWDLPVVAIVGTRRASHYGLAMAERVSGELAGVGVVIVSGMARGCDSAAHRGALSVGGKTVAVLGTGIDRVYPRENKRLYDEIAETGLLMSEFPISTPPLPHNFPIRNRIISGLSLGVLVVEAPIKSGAMTTAKLALDDGREVFAMPGQATSKKSTGTNKLIKDGAMLVEGAVDILEALSITVINRNYRPRSAGAERGSPGDQAVTDRAIMDEGQLIMDLLEDQPLHIDAIAEKTGLPVQRAASVLLDMELRGLIEQQPGKIFVKRL